MRKLGLPTKTWFLSAALIILFAEKYVVYDVL